MVTVKRSAHTQDTTLSLSEPRPLTATFRHITATMKYDYQWQYMRFNEAFPAETSPEWPPQGPPFDPQSDP